MRDGLVLRLGSHIIILGTIPCPEDPKGTIDVLAGTKKTCFDWFQDSACRDVRRRIRELQAELDSRDQARLMPCAALACLAFISSISSLTYVSCFFATSRIAYNPALPSSFPFPTSNLQQTYNRKYILPTQIRKNRLSNINVSIVSSNVQALEMEAKLRGLTDVYRQGQQQTQVADQDESNSGASPAPSANKKPSRALQRRPQQYDDDDDESEEEFVMPPKRKNRRMVPVHQSRIADRPVKKGAEDSSLKIKIELDLEVEVSSVNIRNLVKAVANHPKG